MQRRSAALDGMIAGWALGAWESGLSLTNAGFAGTGWVYLLTPLLNLFFYGVGGWLLGRALGRLPGWRPLLAVLVLIGAGGLWYLNRRVGLPNLAAWPSIAAGMVAFFSLTALAVFGRAEAAPRLLGRLSWAGPLLVLAAMVFVGRERVTTGPAPTAPAPEAPNIVLLSWDTVRADLLPLYGGGGLDMPSLERFAAEGTTFDDFQSVASITGPAHATMLSGLYPPSHGLRSNGEQFAAAELHALPGLLREHGYATGGFVSGYPITARFGFAEGFQVFDDRSGSSLPDQLRELCRFSSSLLRTLFFPEARLTYTVPGPLTVARAKEWYEAQDRPTFLWVHLYDAHGPFEPPAAHREAVLARRDEGPHAFDPALEEDWLLHKAEISLLDELLGSLRESLEARDPGLRDTLFLLVADHGECFGEGGLELNHEKSLYAATQHVPAVIRLPASEEAAPRGVRSAAAAAHVDLVPTVLDLLGIDAPQELHGHSLLPVLRGTEGGRARGLYMEAYQRRLEETRMSGWMKDGWKVVWTLDGRSFLYHPETGDTVDRAAEEPARLAEMLAEGRAYFEALPQREAVGELTAEDTHALEQLGYIGDDH